MPNYNTMGIIVSLYSVLSALLLYKEIKIGIGIKTNHKKQYIRFIINKYIL